MILTRKRLGFGLGPVLLASVLMALAWAGAHPARASSTEPIFVAGNPTCTGLGYDFGFKVDPPNAGTYNIPGTSDTVTVVTDGVYFSWASTLGMDAVIAKGGPNANVYVYDPPTEKVADAGLHSPINPSTGQPYGLSHIEFCYDFELDASKTANTTFVRTFNWDIDKSVTPESWDLFTGDAGTSKYTVAVTKGSGVDSDWAVNGSITIENNTPFAATVTGVSDAISGFGPVAVNCSVSFPHQLAAGASLTCSYASPLPDGATRTNTATVTTTGTVGGDSATADVIFGDPTTLVNDTINVDDTNGQSWMFSDSGSVMYERTFDCGDEGTHGNTATIVETGQSDSAAVTVNCHDLTVTKNARTSLTRTWNWTIDKSADQTDLVLAPGQLFNVNYTVVVDATSTDSDHAVEGEITIANPHPTQDAPLTAVSDVISPDIAATVDCPQLTVPAGGTLQCSYSADLPDGANRTNTATASLQNYAYGSDGSSVPSGTTDFAGSAAVDFSGASVTEVDECIDVSDTNVGFLGTVCAGDAPDTFIYTLTFGQSPYADVSLVCGDNTHVNTASFVTNDTAATDTDMWTVNASVACDLGCTLTQGYWKTHSEFGPAPYDDTWAQLPGGASTTFFLSGQTYHDVLVTAPAGNAYYNLAHQYIAAQLNQLNGASIPADVEAAFDQATTLFNTYTPADIAAVKGNKPPRTTFVALANILDGYNNGLTGPGHCSE